jgi:hypothetical protein
MDVSNFQRNVLKILQLNFSPLEELFFIIFLIEETRVPFFNSCEVLLPLDVVLYELGTGSHDTENYLN